MNPKPRSSKSISKITMLQKHKSKLFLFLISGFFQLVIYYNLFTIGNLGENITLFLSNYILLFAVYSLTLYYCMKNGFVKSYFSRYLALMFLFSILFRSLMVISDVSLSTDILRYLWDGMLLNNGIDPYKYIPLSSELDRFKDVEFYQAYDHKGEFTPYPPFSQLFFTISYLIFNANITGMKFLLSVFDIINGALIILLILKIRGDTFQAFQGALIYLWNPLVIIEFSHSGHIDALAIFLTLLSLYFLSKLSVINSSVLILLSALTKWFSLLFVPLYIRYLFKKSKRYFSLAIVSISIAFSILVIPFYLSSRFNFVMGMIYFIKNWRFESFLSRIITISFQLDTPGELYIAKITSYLIFLGSYFFILYKSKLHQVSNVIEYSILTLLIFYLVTPAIFPWYMLWILALFSILKIDRRTWLAIALSGISVISYVMEFYPLSELEFWFAYMLWFVPIVCIYFLHISELIKHGERARASV